MSRGFALAFLSLALTLSRLEADQFATGQGAASVLGQTDFVSGDAASLPNRFDTPRGVAMDGSTGKVFVADSRNSRILRFSSTAALANGSFPEAVIGQPDFVSNQVNQGGAARQRTLSSLAQITVDHQGRLWVADAGNHRVLCYVGASFAGNNQPADFVFGQPDFTTVSPGLAQNKMNAPGGIAVGNDDTLWVAEESNHRILRFDNISLKTSGANADGVLGQTDYLSNISGSGTSGVEGPESLSLDSSGRLWVADTGNRRVLRFDDAASLPDGAPADAVLGQTDFSGTAPGNGPSRFAFVFGVQAGPDGTLYVGDFNNSRVMGFRNAASKANGAAADFVLCQPDFSTNSPGLSDRKTEGIGNLCLSPSGHLFVIDINNDRVLRFVPVKSPSVTIKTRGARTRTKTASIRGTVAGEVTKVTYRVGSSGAFRSAKGTASWNFTANLKPGKNVITVVAEGPGGSSAPKKLTITRE